MTSERVIQFPGGDDARTNGAQSQGHVHVSDDTPLANGRWRRQMYLVSVQHQAAAGLYTRLLVLDASLSIADAADAILTCYGWPERVERFNDTPDHTAGDPWNFRISGRTYAPADGTWTAANTNESIGTSMWTACEGHRAVGMTGLLQVGEHFFSVTIADHRDVEARQQSSDAETGDRSQAGQRITFRDPVLRQPEDTITRALGLPALGLPGPGLQGMVAAHGGEGLALLPDAKLVSCDYVSLRREAHSTERTGPRKHANRQHPLGIRKWPSIADINVELAGEATVEHVLGAVKPELRRWLETAESCDFIPLLQSLDLDRPAVVSEQAAELLADAPVEREPQARAAAWAHIIALSTLVRDADSEHIREAFMELAGYPGTSAKEVRRLCTRTRKVLAMAGADNWAPSPRETTVPLVPRSSVVDRLEMYRFLLQH